MNQEVHIMIGCADARDMNHLQTEVLDEMTALYKTRGTHVDLHVLRVAGSFITADVIMDVKRTIEQNQRQSSGQFDDSSYYVHIQTHGHLDEHSNKNYISHIYEMNIVPGSALNCGMLEATTVGIEIEEMLIEQRVEVVTPIKTIVIDGDDKIPELLNFVYGFKGHLAGDWLKGIDKLRTHPRLQRTILEKGIDDDPELSRLNIKITAGIQDYSIHGLIRLDGGIPKVPFWDEAQAAIRERASSMKDQLAKQAQKQDPWAGLISMSDPRRTSRLDAARYYMKLRNIPSSEAYLPNTIFHMSGTGFDLPESPFSPYAIGGFYYSIKYLHLKEYIVMGYDDEQTKRIMLKLHNDPIMNCIIKKFDVELIAVSQTDIRS